MDGARTTEEAAGRRRTGDGCGADGRTGGDGPPGPRCGGHGADPAREGPDLARGAGGGCHGGGGRARPRRRRPDGATGRRRPDGGADEDGLLLLLLLLLRLDLKREWVWGLEKPPLGARRSSQGQRSNDEEGWRTGSRTMALLPCYEMK